MPNQGAKMSNLGPILKVIKAQYKLEWHGTHGVRHWARVRRNGRIIGEYVGLCSQGMQVVDMFAIFHDACRENEWADPDHGPRGAALAHSMRDEIGLNAWQMKHLLTACEIHTSCKRDSGLHLIVKACLDADRSDLGRVGIRLQPEYIHNIKALKMVQAKTGLKLV